MQTPKWAIVASVLVIASMILVACGPTPSPVVQTAVPVVQTVVVPGGVQTVVVVQTAAAPPTAVPPAVQPVLRANQGTYPDIFDPQKSSFVNEIGVLTKVYEGLTTLNTKLETVPGAADKWEYNEDATVLTFHIRDGLKYSDGTMLNAKRFEYSLLRNINPETAGEYAAITDDIAGAAEWRAADTTAEDYDPATFIAAVGVKALDASGNPCLEGEEGYAQVECNQVQITTKGPAPYFHTVMSLWVTFPAKQENIEAGGEQWWNSSKYQIGNGPYVLKTVEPFVRMYFVPSPSYWRGLATYDIEYRFITDAAVAFEAYKNNEFEVVGYGAEDLAQINADDTLKAEAQLYAGSCTFALMMHQEREPFTDKKVREAFATSIDREAWVRDVLGGLGAPTLTWIPPGYPGYDAEETRFAFDAEAAKASLAESSYGGAAGLPTIKWTFGDTARGRTRAEWQAAQFQNVLGVTVQLDPVEPTTFTAMTKDKATSPMGFILGWCADYPDPQNWLSVYWKTGAFGERIGYTNPEADALMVQGDTTIDPAKRLEYYMEAQRMVIGDLPAVMYWNNVNTRMVKPWVTGFEVTPQDNAYPGDIDPLTITVGQPK